MQISGTDNLIMLIIGLIYGLVVLIIIVLTISVLWRLYRALGIYIREHEPEEDEDDEEEKAPGEKSSG